MNESISLKNYYHLNNNYYFIFNSNGDPRVNNLPLVNGGPWKVFGLILSYLIFVRYIGPNLMKNREPFNLRSFILLYNSFLIGLNSVVFLIGLWATDFGLETFNCSPIDANTKDIKKIVGIYLGYIFFISKFIDFIDTFIFILRKSYHQLTFLHIFHHSIMPFIAYLGLKYHPGGCTGFLPLINVFVHTIMYTYYALSCAGEGVRKHLWWKKYITILQLIQFVLIFIHSLYTLSQPSCSWPRLFSYLSLIQSSVFFALFISFYMKAYSQKISSSTSSTSSPSKSSSSSSSQPLLLSTSCSSSSEYLSEPHAKSA